jgi:hypothetical protein
VRTDAYGDYVVRLREAITVLEVGLASERPSLASATAKSAAVLATAALERFVNDTVVHTCARIMKASWTSLSLGHRRYLCRQMARRLEPIVRSIAGDEQLSDEAAGRFRGLLADCGSAFENPSSWRDHQAFGLFTNAANEPERLNRIVSEFGPDGSTLFTWMEVQGRSVGVFARALSDLVEARHGAAHALAGSPAPGPKDAQAWIVLSFWLVRSIEAFLSTTSPATLQDGAGVSV